MPAAVVMATVAEPVATRINAATNQEKKIMLIFAPVAISAIAWPTPLLISTCLNAPPAPMISTIDAIGARHSLVNLEMSCFENPRLYPSEKKENTTAIKSAMISWPINSQNSVIGLVALGSMMLASEPISIRITGSKIVNSVMPKLGSLRPSLTANCSASSAGGCRAMRLPIYLPNKGPAMIATGSPTRSE